MQVARRLLVVLVATFAVGLAGIIVPAGAAANSDVNVYTTPGHHVVNGREWRTECSPYDANITRCRAEIKSGGVWVFNNLTYLAVHKDLWFDNPLSKPGHFWSDGRQWVTSCHDDWTGKNACRSFLFSGGKWVFNNLVYFTPGTALNPPGHFNQATGLLTVDGQAMRPEATLNKGGSSGLDQTNANTKKVIRHVWANWPRITTMYGWRQDVTPDHPGGRAVDIMIPGWRTDQGRDLGWQIASYYRANASQFGINYIIFDQQIWSVARDAEGWRPMADRGNPTANHKDHVHVNTYAVR